MKKRRITKDPDAVPTTSPETGGLRCEMTGNDCGTDTWTGTWVGSEWVGHVCPCKPCQQYHAATSAQLKKLPYFAEVEVQGRKGLTLGMSHDGIRCFGYAVWFYDSQLCESHPFESLKPTGVMSSREQFYEGGLLMKVRVDRRGRGKIVE